MRTYFDAAVNGEWLSGIDESVCVLDVRESENTSISTAERGAANGSRWMRKARTSLSVKVRFVIAQQDPQRRMHVLQLVQSWAGKGGRIEVDYRLGQSLQARCDGVPVLSSASTWTEVLEIVFTAYEFPFWTDEDAARAVISSSGILCPAGTFDGIPCDALVTNTGSGSISQVTVKAGSTSLVFAGLTLRAGETLAISHDDAGVMSARIGEESVLIHRTEDSSDDLLVSGGEDNAITVSADGTVEAVFRARGVYL